MWTVIKIYIMAAMFLLWREFENTVKVKNVQAIEIYREKV
jgi:hypothetical protein